MKESESPLPPLNRMVILVGDVGNDDQKIYTFQLTTAEAEKFIEFLEILPSIQKSHSDYYKIERSTYENVVESILDEGDGWRTNILTPQIINLGLEILEWEIIPIDIHTIVSVDVYELGNEGRPLYEITINDSRYTFNKEENI